MNTMNAKSAALVTEIRVAAMRDLQSQQLEATDTIVGRGVDVWAWAVIYDDGSAGAIDWGERHERGTPVGQVVPVERAGVVRELRVDFAVRVALCAQIRCRDELGVAVTRRMVLPLR